MEKITIETLQNMHPYDLSELFLNWDIDEREYWIPRLSIEQLSEMFSYLDPEEAAEYIRELNIEKKAQLLDLMEPNDVRNILFEMEENEKQDILDKLKLKYKISKLLSYDEDESGAHMTNNFISLTPEMDVKLATKKVIAHANDVDTISRLFVVDKEGNFLGAVSLKKLIKTKSPKSIEAIMEDYPHVLDTEPIDEIIHKMRDYSAFEMPVCNESNLLVGMIMMDDALDAYHEEATEDYEKLSALPETEEEDSYFKQAAKRLPWLLILLILSIPIAYITTFFEDILVAVSVLAFFQPLILDASGDVATQTLAVTLRILTKNPKLALKNGAKEVLTGILTGFIMGLSASIIAYFLAIQMNSTQPLTLAFVVGFSLWISVIISPILGVLIPLGIDKLHFDPAVASGPFITTLSDLTSLLVFFGLATTLLGGM